MGFQENLSKLPSIEHLVGLDVRDQKEHVLLHIPAAPGKLGSLKIYHALSLQFNQTLNPNSAAHGLSLFAEHVDAAVAHPGQHPNIDFLQKVIAENLQLSLHPIVRA